MGENSLILVEQLPIDHNPAAVYLASNSKSGQRPQGHALDVIASMLKGLYPSVEKNACLKINWAALRFKHTAAIRARLVENYSPASTNRMLAAMRGTLKAAWQLGQMSSDDYHIAISVKNVQGETLPAGRELSAGELSALINVCSNDSTPAGARDAAIIAVMYGAGLRREEVVNLELADYDSEVGRLVVKGKRNKERTAYVRNGGSRALDDWLHVRGDFSGPLFVPIIKGGKLTERIMTTQAIYNMLKKRAGQAGIGDFSPHDLRRTFVSDLLDAGADITTVAKMAGHASVNTTARYDRRPEETKKKAADLLHVPYSGRG